QLLALWLRGFLPIDGGNHAELMVDLLDRILKLAVQYRAIRYDDDAAEDGVPIVAPQFNQIVCGPRNRTGLAGSRTMVGQIRHARAVLLGVSDHVIDR